MSDAITAYFGAERLESVVFAGAGLAALAVAGWAWTSRRAPFWRGLAWPLAAVAAIQLAVGATVFVRSPADDARVHARVADSRGALAATEIPRMRTVMRNFELYRAIELTLVVAGALLVVVARRSPFLRGMGTGLAVQAGLMLVLDLFAERRGTDYLRFLEGG